MTVFSETPILHVDADAFFPSVEQRLEPRYRGKPLIVGGDHRGVVSSASYEARKFGVHSAMPIYKARKLCPHGIFIKGNHAMYREFSQRMFYIFRKYTPTVEITSIDEGYLDLSGTRQLHGADYPTIANRILHEVQDELGITISGGLSTAKMISKIASSRNKPRKLTWIWAGHEQQFLHPLPLQAMPGLGPKTLPKLTRLGLKTLGDLAAMPFETMWQLMGGHGIHLWERAQGIDSRSVSEKPHNRKSISEEKTFPFDIDSQDFLVAEAQKMLKDLCYRLRQNTQYAQTLTLKIRYQNFDTHTHQKTLTQGSNHAPDFYPALHALFKNRDHKRKIRLIGVGLGKLQTQVQLDLFTPPSQAELDQKLDHLRKKYGVRVI